MEAGGAEGAEGGFIVAGWRGTRSWNCMCAGMWWRVRGLGGGLVAIGEMSLCDSVFVAVDARPGVGRRLEDFLGDVMGIGAF